MYTHKQEAQQVLTPPVVEPERYRLHNTEAGVKVPFSQALISGVVSGMAALIIAWVFDVLDPWKPGLVMFALITPLVWFTSRRNWVGLVNRVEEWTGLDLPGNDAPEDKPVTRVEWNERTSRVSSQTQYLEIPVAPEKFGKLAIAILLMHKKFTFENFAGRGKLFSDGQLETLQGFLAEHNFIVRKNPSDKKSGYEFTPRGIKLLQSHLPYPTGADGVSDDPSDR